jgi:S-DNA-T family DNA segregation ATPase FtsK/SpoIIIE
MTWLPHGGGRHGEASVIAPDDHDALDALDHQLTRWTADTTDHLPAPTASATRPPERPITIVVTDDLEALTVKTGRLRRIVDRHDVAALAVSERVGSAPAGATTTVELGAVGAVTVTAIDADSGSLFDASQARRRGHASGISAAAATRAARVLAPLVDPEADAGDAQVPTALTLTELLGHDALTARSVLDRWEGAADAPSPAAPLGRAGSGRVDIDLRADGPHGLIAGTTGSGKSELLRTLVISLALHHPPDAINFVLVDYKGGSTFDACVDLPHTVGLVTDLDDGLAERALVSLDAELHRRERLLRTFGAADLDQYPCSTEHESAAALPRLVVVIDEFASLARDVPEFLRSLVDIAQRGRSLGVHLVLATQRPAGVVSDDIRANTNMRIALRLHDRADATDVIGDPTAARLPRGVPGRALLRLGPSELVTFQVASCGAAPPECAGGIVVETIQARDAARHHPADDRSTRPSELAVAVEAIQAAHRTRRCAPPHRPWVDPLPAVLTPATLRRRLQDERKSRDEPGSHAHDRAPGSTPSGSGTPLRSIVGLVDEPDRQAVGPLSWDRTAGNLALSGAMGGGTTTTLLTLIDAICATTAPTRTHVYVIDARGDDRVPCLTVRPHVGAVVGTTDGERLRRLLLRLDGELDSRLDDPTGERPEIVMAVDGIAALRNELTALDRTDLLTTLARIVADGPPVGIRTVFTTTDHTTLPTAFATTWTWTFLHGLSSAPGTRAASTAAPPGRVRITPGGRIAQLALDPRIGTAHTITTHTITADAAADVTTDAATHVAPADPAPADPVTGGPAPIGVLPREIAWDELVGHDPDPSAVRRDAHVLSIGLDADALTTAHLTVPHGDSIVVLGSGRTGVSSTLAAITAAWAARYGSGAIHRVADSAALAALLGELDRDRADDHHSNSAHGAASSVRVPPRLVVIDDADRVDDPGGRLAARVARRQPDLTVAAGARIDVVRSLYGHWIRTVAQSRCGVVLTSTGEVDGDLLGTRLPQRPPIPARPGLGWIIDCTGHQLAQVALSDGMPTIQPRVEPTPTVQPGVGGSSPSR